MRTSIGMSMQGRIMRFDVSRVYVSVLRRDREEFLTAMDQLADLLEAGISLERAFGYLTQQGQKGSREVGERMLHRLENGLPLSDVFLDYVDPVHLNIFHLAEQVGRLPQALGDYVEHERERRRWRKDMSQKLTYPAMLLVACYGLAVYVRLQVQPELAQLQVELGNNTGLGMTSKIVQNIPITLLSLISILPCLYVAVVLCRRFTGKRIVSLPFDALLQFVYSEQFVYGIEVQIDGGLTLIEALHFHKEGRNARLERDYAEVQNGVMAGFKLSQVLPATLNPVLQQIIEVGEYTGDLSDSLHRARMFLLARIKRQTDRISTWLEPCAMAVMGLIVGSSMYSVFGPMYQTVSSMGLH
ncbi:type II secretion system F family protein [Alicyclobacillus dauci]|uniref:Type II secretion system F family protein n=1 Tax=Alicyclobacillus dauci TaxID=1475485 RepID=A0ABY6Z858_9BACL|nr:type II secretion system F family protein [Alicyclobacillus dauci]WAH38979.1 type II secretion system F family protein [Alicyclobacillus dauci]